MSSLPSKAPSAAGPSRSSLPRSSSEGEVDQDQLAFTIESPSIPQIQFFENVFNTGKSLAAYCRDDPLWSTLAAVALPCSNCTKHPETCKVPEGSPRCAFCTDLAYSRRFLETHGTPVQRVSWTIPEDVWCSPQPPQPTSLNPWEHSQRPANLLTARTTSTILSSPQCNRTTPRQGPGTPHMRPSFRPHVRPHVLRNPMSQSGSGGVTKRSREAEQLSRVVNAERLSGAGADWSQDNDRVILVS
ncbi:hypothetical protein C8R41DRAFT_918640 [Lentinula lateritia]|uniref:Uncharacterized protein n=1 Tax=Lentinula lateritia TaxID=40482 RepID=A0ABQ8VIP7_9AGAR|nr:hypothetical protein C8R41DRAFT_918640 [Lentinula lateritia]